MTVQRPRDRNPTLSGTKFRLHSVSSDRLFGLKTVWRGQSRAQVSDMARTLADVLGSPALGGGIRHVAQMLATLLREHGKEAARLAEYVERIGNGAAFKRLGYLLEAGHADQIELIEACRSNLTAGYAKLDPQLPAPRLVTAWRVWVPATGKKAVTE